MFTLKCSIINIILGSFWIYRRSTESLKDYRGRQRHIVWWLLDALSSTLNRPSSLVKRLNTHRSNIHGGLYLYFYRRNPTISSGVPLAQHSRRSQNLGQDNILRPMQTRMSKQFKTPVSDNRNTRGGPDNRIGCDECLVPISRHLGQSGLRRPA